MDPANAIDERAHGTGGWAPRGARVAGVALTLACGLLFGCASVQSAGDSFVGWLHPDEPAAAEAAPPANKTTKSAAKKPAATPSSVATETPVEAPAPEAADPAPPAGETQAPESIFDPY